MRLNAPIPAFLALAVLSLLPATLLAKTTQRRAHKATATQSKSPKKAPARTVHHHKAASPELTRVRAHQPTRHHLHRNSRVAATRPTPAEEQTAAEAAPQKATSGDFLKAASAHAEAPAANPAADTSRRVEAPEPARSSRSRTRRAAPVAKSIPASNPIRPATEASQSEYAATEAATPVILPALYNKRGHLIIPPPLKGSREILLRQNEVADRDGLDRIQNDEDLRDMRGKRMLVALPISSALQVDERLPADRRYCRPWTAHFLANLSRAHYARFHTPLKVNSAVRTVEFQQRLIRINGNAAPADGDTASPHLTGQAVDLAKRGLSRTEVAWMRSYLLRLMQQGKIDVEEEFQQSCFHISVYKKYLPPSATPKRSIAASHHGETSALAAAIR